MSFFRTIAGGVAVHILMKYCFPQQYDMLFVSSFTKTIYLYSFLEILFKKQLKGTEQYPIVKNIMDIFKKTQNEIEVIKFNEPCFAMSLDDYNNWIHYRIDYDFIIYSHKESEESTMYNRVLYHTIEKPIIPASYKLCGFSFISIQVSIEDIKDRSKTNSYYLKLRTDGDNYYIAGNKINREVVLYLLKTHYNVDYPPFTTYIIDMIDFNANIQFLTEKDTICLLENDYKISHDDVKLTLQIPETIIFDDDSETESDSESETNSDDLPDLIEIENESENESELNDLPELIEMNMDLDNEYKPEFQAESPDIVRVESNVSMEDTSVDDKKEDFEMNIDEETSQMNQMIESDDKNSVPKPAPKQKRKYNKRKIA